MALYRDYIQARRTSSASYPDLGVTPFSNVRPKFVSHTLRRSKPRSPLFDGLCSAGHRGTAFFTFGIQSIEWTESHKPELNPEPC